VNRPQRRFDAEHDDQPLDLTPAAKVEVIADIAACLCPVGGLQPCSLAELVDQRFGFDNIAWFDIKRQIHMGAGFLIIIGRQGRRIGCVPAWICNTQTVSQNGQSNWLAQINLRLTGVNRACLSGAFGGKGAA
jgi:hypothetical protein